MARIKKFSFSLEVFPRIFKTGNEFLVREGIPDGAKAVGLTFNDNNDICIHVYHKDFEDVDGEPPYGMIALQDKRKK